MKRFGGLFDIVVSFENLHKAFRHAVCNVMRPIFERTFIFDSYACRDKKGTHAAVFRLQDFMRKSAAGYALQCDIRKYFQSVDREILKILIRRKIKDNRLLCLVNSVIDSAPEHPDFGPGKGLPIGNLTSQLFANIYLDPLDHFIKEVLHCGAYVRYVDDLVIVEDGKERLHGVRKLIAGFLEEKLKLAIHRDKCHVFPCRKGATFLGYRVWRDRRRVKTATLVRIRRGEKAMRRDYWEGNIAAEKYWQTIASFFGHLKWGDRGGSLTRSLPAKRSGAKRVLSSLQTARRRSRTSSLFE